MVTMAEAIEKELEMVRTKCPQIEGVQLITCVPAMIRIHIRKTAHKELTVTYQFPAEYPKNQILFELKSKVISERLLDGLTRVTEQEAKKLLGQYQVLPVLQFIKKFIEDNPLCVCSEEINYIKQNLLTDADEIKLKQKLSQVVLKLKQDAYYLHVRCTIPDQYPVEQMKAEISDHNFPDMLKANFASQAMEITRQCVQPPLKRKPKDPPFEPKPSLKPVAHYLVNQIIRNYPKQVCPLCNKRALPENPQTGKSQSFDMDPSHAAFTERVYCGHLFHHGCLDEYMKTPPFTGGKKCPECGNRIYHDKWKATPQVAEARWAHKEARQRELAEVVEFLE